MFVLQDAAHPHNHGCLILRYADVLAFEVLGPSDAAVGVHVDAVVTEGARGESGNGGVV